MSKIYLSLDLKTAKKWALLTKQKKLRRIYHGIYTDNFNDPIESTIKRHWMEIVSHIVSRGILSFRTAFDLKPIPYKKFENIVFMTSSYTKTINLPGLIIKVYKSNKGNFQEYSEQVLPNLARSNIPRMLLENLTIVKKADLKGIKTIGAEQVERYLAKELQHRGEIRLNQIRDEAKEIATSLGFNKEYKTLNSIISALLSTNEKYPLKSPFAKAIVQREPYDETRLFAFEKLSLYLQKCRFRERSYQFSKISFRNLSFFESYFSNYIEGTEFIIDEAEEIIFKGVEINNRHADSHDVLANFNISNDYTEMCKTPLNAQELIDILKTRHGYLMKERPEKNPGEFKQKPNKAGNTYFVDPQNVIGTLTRGFELYKMLEPGLSRALFMHHLITEIHPFTDGNGRMARIMMNAELVQAGLYKIIIPTVYRDNYLGALRLATRDEDFLAYCKVMDQAQAYVQTISWNDYGESRSKIETDHANQSPDEGLPFFNRIIRTIPLSIFSS